MRRKFLAVLLVLAMMFSSIVPSFAVASGEQRNGDFTELVLSAETKTDVELGENFTYSVKADANPGIWGLSFVVSYDTSALEYVSASSTVFEVGDETVTTRADGSLGIVLENSDFEDITDTGAIIEFTFKANAVGVHDVTITCTDESNIINVDEKAVPAELNSGSVTVSCSHPVDKQTTERVEPTDTEDGYVKVTCTKCEEVLSDTTLPHEYLATITGETKTVVKGDAFDYVISLTDTTRGVWGLHFDVKYDTSILNYTGVVVAEGFNSDDATVAVVDGGLKITLDRDDLSNITDTGAIVTLKFKAAAEGETDVALSADDGNIVSVDEKAVDTTFASGKVTVDACTHENTTTERVEPTDTEDGYVKVICNRCDEVISNVVLPHEYEATITGEDKTVEKGDAFDYVISLTDTTRGVWGLHFDVKYDATALEYTGFTVSDSFNSDDVTVVAVEGGLKVTLDRDELKNVTDTGALITLKFKALAEGEVSVALSAEDGNIVSVDEKAVDTTFVNGKVTVEACTHAAGTTETSKDPTETEDGYVKVICDKCGDVVSEKVIPAIGKVAISGEEKTVEKGDAFDYVISIDSTNRGVWGLHFDVKFDTTVLEYTGFESDLFSSGDAIVVTTDDGIKITLANGTFENISTDGALITLKFKAIAEGNTDVTVELEDDSIVDVDENVVSADVENGSVTVGACGHTSTHIVKVDATETEYGHINIVCDKCGEVIAKHILLGDAQLDGDVDGADIVLIKRYSVGLVEFNDTQLTTSDTNSNGTITAKDILLIRRHVSGLIDLGYID